MEESELKARREADLEQLLELGWIEREAFRQGEAWRLSDEGHRVFRLLFVMEAIGMRERLEHLAYQTFRTIEENHVPAVVERSWWL